MTIQRVAVPGPVAVIVSPKVVGQLDRRPDQLIGEYVQLSATGSLPARVEPERQRLVVYTSRHVSFLYLTGRADAYRLGHVSRRTFRDEDRLLAGALLVHCARGWYAYQDVRDLPQGTGLLNRPMSSYWTDLCRAWAALAAASAPPTPAVPARHAAHLDLLTWVVQASRDIEIARQEARSAVPYRRRGDAREQRYSSRGVYTFELLRPSGMAAGTVVYVVEQPDLRGRVVRADGRDLVVRFETVVDYRRIPPQGSLRVMPSDRVYRAQLAAVDTLRTDGSANRHLLAAMVDGRYQPYRPEVAAQPRRVLHPRQMEAYTRALAVPDLLLVLGPPGTGKTTTITEIALACVARGQRVLVTSHTNRAVDNVLDNLPADVRAVRVGSEDAMTAAARTFMVETHADELRASVLAATADSAGRLAEFDGHGEVIGRWLGHLAASLADAHDADARARTADAAVDEAVRRSGTPLHGQIEAAEAELSRCRAAATDTERDLAGARDRLTAAQARAAGGVLAFAYRWLSTRHQRRVEALRRQLPALRAASTAADAHLAGLRAQVATLAATDPQVRRLAGERDAAQQARAAALAEVARAAQVVRGSLRPFLPVPEQNPGDLAGWDEFRRRVEDAVSLVRSRAALLAEWRTRIGDVDAPLQRELVRYADVVAATCIGTATSALLADLDFDLAIVDEAGQISTPNLLVPLVRARRGVLVGDHRQLPPFLDDEVRRWADSLAGTDDLAPDVVRQVGELLRASGFERLYPAAGEANRVMLTLQRRMPRVLADFVSTAFYGDVLRTEHPGAGTDPVFGSAFAMVDTSDRPPAERFDLEVRGSEAWRQRGYRNELEAELVTALLCRYAGWYRSWAVIVPYRAQAELIVTRLTGELGDAGRVVDNVGTVDSFQGGERDLIVYGFTRSNADGRVGFLAELRRLNVAITRARQQLVLVGDGATLRAARDRGFAELMRSMTDYLRRHGDLRSSAEIGALLARAAEPRP